MQKKKVFFRYFHNPGRLLERDESWCTIKEAGWKSAGI